MKLEIGKKYKDRFNTVFTIISDQAKPPYKYVGQSMTTGALIGFTCNGQAAHCSGELVQEVKELRKFETIRYAITDNDDKCPASMAYYSTTRRVRPQQVKVRITIEEVEE